jgi:hypothetical protein
LNGSNDVADGKWRLVVGVVQRTTGATLFVDCSLDATQSINTVGDNISNGDAKAIGAFEGGTTDFFNGAIGDVSIFGQALSPSDVRAMYDVNGGCPALTVPGAPTSAIASPGSSKAVVFFDPPTSSGGTPITSYTVTATDSTTPANGGQMMAGPASPVTVTGLTDGDSYTFTVAATNAVGTGPPSVPSNAVVPSAISAPILNLGTFNCAGPSAGAYGGFVTAQPLKDGRVMVDMHLRGAFPDTTYYIANSCRYFFPYTLTTDAKGNGNVRFSFTPQAGQTELNFDGTANGPIPGRSNFESMPIPFA